MRNDTAPHTPSASSGHSVVRLLITSYFVAASVGLISGTDMIFLASPFMPQMAAKVLTAVVVIALAAGIVFGVQRRAAALLLALMLFWASYIANFTVETAQPIAAFWRDLALIGALLLTYADRENARANDAVALAQQIKNPSEMELVKRISQPKDVVKSSKRRPVSRQFREDFEHIQAG
ncbi:MAG: hypothetical protein OXQ92_18135 [Boseongicola sp.]|nr:hypothetical protein [Boseongicola sp.]